MSGKRTFLTLMKTYEIIQEVDEKKGRREDLNIKTNNLKGATHVNLEQTMLQIHTMMQRKTDELALSHKVVGESTSVDPAPVREWIPLLRNIPRRYQPQDVYNLMADHTPAVKEDKYKGAKRSKESLTVLLCCETDGSDKTTHCQWTPVSSQFPARPPPTEQRVGPSMEPQLGSTTAPLSPHPSFPRPCDEEMWQRLAADFTYEEYIAADNDITVWGPLDDADIIVEQQESGEEEMEEGPEDILTTKDVLKAGDVYSRTLKRQGASEELWFHGPAAGAHGLVHPEQEVPRDRLDTGEQSCSKDGNESSDKEVHWMDRIILSRDSQDVKDGAKPSHSTTTSPESDFGDDSKDFENVWESGICLGRGNRPVWLTKTEETKVARVREVSSDTEEDNLQQGFGRGVLRERYRSVPHPPVMLGRGSGACFDSFYM
uniref:Uncharacterized protein n=1 Tax=Timema douglasi TaxID=61478 RepID=A0A7R8ZE41_TIMDO|nr:unnamed protein product [Timema douglasi]